MTDRVVMTSWSRATDKWCEEMTAAGRSTGTIGTRRSHLRRFARVCPTPDAATRETLIAWLGAERWSPEYRRSARSTLVGFYTYLADNEMISENPAARLPKVRVPIAEPRPAADDHIRQTLMRAKKRERIMVMLMSTCGLRRAETAAVHTSDLMLDNRLRVKGKGGKVRVVPVDPSLAQVIRMQDAGWLFPNGHGHHLTSAHVGVLLRRVLPEGVTPHMLRHAAASALHEYGLSLFEIRDFLGHASIATTQRYVLVKSLETIAAVSAIAERFAA